MRLSLLASVALSVVLVAACERKPADAGGASAAAAPAAAPAAEAAPALPEPTSPEDAAQAAQALDQTTSTAAPEVATYSFDEAGANVSAAEDPTLGLRLVEGARTYFYRPGEDAPYLVREGDYDYAYKGGRLSGVLDRQGRRVNAKALEARRQQAEQALSHGRALRRTAHDKAPAPARQAEPRRPTPDRSPAGGDRRPDGPGDRARPDDHAAPSPAHGQADRHDTSPHDASPPDASKGDRSRGPGGRGDADKGPDGDRGQSADRDHRAGPDPDSH